MLTSVFAKNCFCVSLVVDTSFRNVIKREMNWQRLLDILLQLKTSHQCGCQNRRRGILCDYDQGKLILSPCWSAGQALVRSNWQPWQLISLCCCYWKCFSFLCTCSHAEFGYFQVQRNGHCHSLYLCLDIIAFFFVAYCLPFRGCIWIFEQKKKTLTHFKNGLPKVPLLCVQDGTDVESLLHC